MQPPLRQLIQLRSGKWVVFRSDGRIHADDLDTREGAEELLAEAKALDAKEADRHERLAVATSEKLFGTVSVTVVPSIKVTRSTLRTHPQPPRKFKVKGEIVETARRRPNRVHVRDLYEDPPERVVNPYRF